MKKSKKVALIPQVRSMPIHHYQRTKLTTREIESMLLAARWIGPRTEHLLIEALTTAQVPMLDSLNAQGIKLMIGVECEDHRVVGDTEELINRITNSFTTLLNRIVKHGWYTTDLLN